MGMHIIHQPVSTSAVLAYNAFFSDCDLQPSGCCDWPSCYDERTQLCLDTCLNTWSQCPQKLFLMTCYSEYMSPFGSLPLQCFPDAAPHIEEAEALGLTGTAKEVREKIHELNIKNCHPKTGICRPNEDV